MSNKFMLLFAVVLAVSFATCAPRAEEMELPPIDADVAQCRALIAEQKGRKHKPSKHELYRVGNAAGLLCDTFTDEEFQAVYVTPAEKDDI